MLIFPAIDLYEGKAVRLLRGDYDQMTVYSDHPEEIALGFANAGAKWIHLVDLEGAKSGSTPNLETVKKIVAASGLSAEVGGGIRSMETVKTYLDAGVSRVILGTAAVTDEDETPTIMLTYDRRIVVEASAVSIGPVCPDLLETALTVD
jgi:phosphoribosylformimino-5-aminoimidazole carboxamide ribotide isomerase